MIPKKQTSRKSTKDKVLKNVPRRVTKAEGNVIPRASSSATNEREASDTFDPRGSQETGEVSATPMTQQNTRVSGETGGPEREKRTFEKREESWKGHAHSSRSNNKNRHTDDRWNRKNKFDRFKEKNDFYAKSDQSQNQKSAFKKNKKTTWQSAPGFAAASDEGNALPAFDTLIEWDLFRRQEALDAFIQEHVQVDAEPLNYNELEAATLKELEEIAAQSEATWQGLPNRRKLIRACIDKARADKRPIQVTGIAEILEPGYGFLVFGRDNLSLKAESPFIAATLIERLGIQRGHEVKALMSAPQAGETCPFVLRVDRLMGQSVEEVQALPPFTELTPYYPTERIVLESAEGALGKWDNISMRVVDLLSPVGLGQRGVIVAPPRTGKTVLLQGIANAIRVTRPEVKLIILLVDERPEEVTDFRRSVDGAEVISSTFDQSAESHVHAAEMVIEKSRRMVEIGRDVIVLLDSITRLARSYNTLMPSSGKILSGGVEANALQKPKRLFGSARNIENGGSLTILGTALVDTGSKMDEVIFEEFKGTGNMELHLDRDLANKRTFPSLSFERSGTRKEELLYHPDEMIKVYALRRAMKGVPATESMEMLIGRVKKTKNNAEFLMGMAR